MLKYFAYGSNMDAQRMIERGINFINREPATMYGVELVFNKIATFNSNIGYANIKLNNKSQVEGILYTISYDDLLKLDSFEGYPLNYDRWEIIVKTNQKKVRAITYIAVPKKTLKGLKVTEEYLNHLLAGKKFLSKNYYEKLKKMKKYCLYFA